MPTCSIFINSAVIIRARVVSEVIERVSPVHPSPVPRSLPPPVLGIHGRPNLLRTHALHVNGKYCFFLVSVVFKEPAPCWHADLLGARRRRLRERTRGTLGTNQASGRCDGARGWRYWRARQVYVAGYAACVTTGGGLQAFKAATYTPPDYDVYDTTILTGFGVLRGIAGGLAFGWVWPVIVPAVAAKYVLAK